MPDKSNETSYLPAVGSRVQVTTKNSADNDDEACSGVVIEVYADDLGHRWLRGALLNAARGLSTD